MNANELADKLQELDSKLHLIDLFKAATMLRQQADDIEAMQFVTECDKKLIKQFEAALCQQADRIAELEQNLSAYIVELELHKAMIQDLERHGIK